MSALIALANLRHLARHRAGTVLAVLGVALGVAATIGIDLARASTLSAFENLEAALVGGATHVLRGGPAGLDEGVYVELVQSEPSLVLAPVLTRTLRASGPLGGTFELVGIDPFAESSLRGAAFRAAPELDALDLAAQSVAVGARTARERGLAVGSALELVVDGRLVRVTVGAVVGDPERGGPHERLLACDLATAQELLDAPGRLTRIDVRASTERAERALERRSRALQSGVVLEPAALRGRALREQVRALEIDLDALALLALFVGALLVYDAITFAVLQRRELFGFLRALGCTRATIYRQVLTEGLWIGISGVLLGSAIGALFAHEIARRLAQSVSALYFAVEVDELSCEPRAFARGALLGLGVTLLGALVPALDAARSSVRGAQLRSLLEERASRIGARLGWAAVLPALLAGFFLWLPSPRLELAFLALFASLCAAACLAPAATQLFARAIASPAGWLLGSAGRIAARSLAASLSRTGVAVAALSIALASAVGMQAMIESFRRSVEGWLELSLCEDVFVWAPNPTATHNTSVLPAELVARLAELEGVEGRSSGRGFELATPSGPLRLTAIELANDRHRAAWRFLEGDASALGPQFESQDVLIVSESLARRRGLGVGQTLELSTDRGPRSFEVRGVYQSFSSDPGVALLSRATYARHFDAGGVSSLGFFLAPGVDAAAFAAELGRQVGADQRVVIQTRRGLREGTLDVFDRTFAVAELLSLFAAGVAAAAVLAALLALELERAREVALLRALGASRRLCVAVSLARAGLLGTCAWLVSVPLGAWIAWLLLAQIHARAFAWTLPVDLSWRAFAASLGLALVAALLAGGLSSLSLLRSDPARALWME